MSSWLVFGFIVAIGLQHTPQRSSECGRAEPVTHAHELMPFASLVWVDRAMATGRQLRKWIIPFSGDSKGT